MRATSQLRVEELLSRLPGVVHRGRAPATAEAAAERLSTGHPVIDDLLGGGLHRGRLSEWVGRGSTGATSLAQHLLARVTVDEHFAAWVDLADEFDPASASAAGVLLHRLLWVRPPDLIAAFAATEILLSTGGFALVLLDTGRMSDIAPRQVETKGGRRMLTAPQTWLRLARAAARSRTALVVLPGASVPPPRRAVAGAETGAEARERQASRLRRAADEQGGLTGAAAGVRLEFSAARAVWAGAPGAPSLLEGLVTRVDLTRNRGGRAGPSEHRRTRIRLA